LRARLGPEWLRVYARAGVRGPDARGGLPHAVALSSCNSRTRARPASVTIRRNRARRCLLEKFRQVLLPFCDGNRARGTQARKTLTEGDSLASGAHRCAPQSVGSLGVYLWVRRTIRAKTVTQYNQLGGRGGGGDGGALNRPRAAACGQRAATPIAQAAQPSSPTPSPGPSGTWQDCVQMPRRARWLSG
jgi:hypothetical protein